MAVEGYTYSFIENSNMDAQVKAKMRKEAGGSVIMALAIALGSVADKMTEKTLSLAGELDSVQDSKASILSKGGHPGSDSENTITAKLQAQTQLMNMFMQAMNNVIKTYGDANATVARKGS
jgi:hypothetical protein